MLFRCPYPPSFIKKRFILAGILAGLPVCPQCSPIGRVPSAQAPSNGFLTNLLAPIFQSNKQFGFICFDSVQACFYCFSHSCISTTVCDWQKSNSSIRLQGVCWESQVSLRIYVLDQIIVTDTTLPASEFGNTRISPIPSPPPPTPPHLHSPFLPWESQIRENKDSSLLLWVMLTLSTWLVRSATRVTGLQLQEKNGFF